MIQLEDYLPIWDHLLILMPLHKVGTIGLGDIEISSDGKTLYVVSIL